ncbi:hypothetical protein ACRRTK_024344 [Alexandromys fortis]
MPRGHRALSTASHAALPGTVAALSCGRTGRWCSALGTLPFIILIIHIGACRLHNKPTFSQTIVLLNLYQNPQNTAQTADGSHCHVSDVEVQEHYDNFFEEVFTELQEYGEIEEMNVWDNLGDHLVGNVCVKFRREEDAERAVTELNNRCFNRQAVHAERSSVTDFRVVLPAVRDGGMYPRWLLQLHAPTTHIPEPAPAALWARTQVTLKIPYRSPSPRKEPAPFPRPPAWSLLRLVLLFLTQGQRRSCAGSLLKALFTPAPSQASELQGVICSAEELAPPIPPLIKL